MLECFHCGMDNMKTRQISNRPAPPKQTNGSNGTSSSPVKRGIETMHALQRREVLRIHILQIVNSVCPRGLALTAIQTGTQCGMNAVTREIQYLLDKALLVEVPKLISPEIPHYRIHANGRDFLAQSGQEDEDEI